MRPIRKVLVANRGEIARRVFRACRSLGLATVAVHSEADRNAAHVADADEAYAIGPAPARESYLDIAKVLAAAQASGADAIHPGYGFLAERAAFAEAAQQAGLAWIGPSPEVIRSMGDKQRAREIAQAAGVPVVPGSPRFAREAPADVESAAAAIGYPVLVKAAAGGGGIGMRRVDNAEKLLETVAATQSMAKNAFGDGTIFLERFVPRARHVEIQVFGFGDGTAIHLFERDCSLQRRFQKVIEESPVPGLPIATSAAMAEAALGLARAVRYAGAGTVEFIVDADSFAFYFLEMNTRIQVEHPVTEMITGADLVGMQIRLVMGTLPPIAQAAITRHGHAIECRLYAENPRRMFLPSPGTLAVFAPPEGMAHVRIETGYRAGDVVTPYYDPMLAKVIAWGEDRNEARNRAAAALRAFAVEGPATNRDFLIACLAHDAFARGDVQTGFIDAWRAELIGG